MRFLFRHQQHHKRYASFVVGIFCFLFFLFNHSDPRLKPYLRENTNRSKESQFSEIYLSDSNNFSSRRLTIERQQSVDKSTTNNSRDIAIITVFILFLLLCFCGNFAREAERQKHYNKTRVTFDLYKQ